MDRQNDINEKMRAILIDWLIEVHLKFRLVPETLYLCVNIIDRYCSVINVPRTKLQLVGVTALFLAIDKSLLSDSGKKELIKIAQKHNA